MEPQSCSSPCSLIKRILSWAFVVIASLCLTSQVESHKTWVNHYIWEGDDEITLKFDEIGANSTDFQKVSSSITQDMPFLSAFSTEEVTTEYTSSNTRLASGISTVSDSSSKGYFFVQGTSKVSWEGKKVPDANKAFPSYRLGKEAETEDYLKYGYTSCTDSKSFGTEKKTWSLVVCKGFKQDQNNGVGTYLFLKKTKVNSRIEFESIQRLPVYNPKYPTNRQGSLIHGFRWSKFVEINHRDSLIDGFIMFDWVKRGSIKKKMPTFIVGRISLKDEATSFKRSSMILFNDKTVANRDKLVFKEIHNSYATGNSAINILVFQVYDPVDEKQKIGIVKGVDAQLKESFEMGEKEPWRVVIMKEESFSLIEDPADSVWFYRGDNVDYQTEVGLRVRYFKSKQKISYEVYELVTTEIVSPTLSFKSTKKLLEQTNAQYLGETSQDTMVSRKVDINQNYFYVCWMFSSNKEDQLCVFVDIFKIDKTVFKASEEKSALKAITFLKREYGNFSSINFYLKKDTLVPDKMMAFSKEEKHMKVFDTSKMQLNYALKLSNATKNFSRPFEAENPNHFLGLTITRIKEEIPFSEVAEDTRDMTLAVVANQPAILDIFTDKIHGGDMKFSVKAGPDKAKAEKDISKVVMRTDWKNSGPVEDLKSEERVIAVGRYGIKVNKDTFSMHLLDYEMNFEEVNTDKAKFRLRGMIGKTFKPSQASGVFAFQNFKSAEISTRGLYIYFEKSRDSTKLPNGIIRFDIITGKASSALFEYQTRAFESKNRIFVVTMKGTESSLATYLTKTSTNLTISFEKDSSGNLEHFTKEETIEIKRYCRFCTINANSISDVSASFEFQSQVPVVTLDILTNWKADNEQTLAVLTLEKRFTDQNTVFSFKNTLIMDNYLNQTSLTFEPQRCIYKNKIMYASKSNKNLTLYVADLSKKSVFKKSYTTDASKKPKLRCMNNHVLVQVPYANKNTETSSYYLFSLSYQTLAYRRVMLAHSSSSKSFPRAYTFSPSSPLSLSLSSPCLYLYMAEKSAGDYQMPQLLRVAIERSSLFFTLEYAEADKEASIFHRVNKNRGVDWWTGTGDKQQARLRYAMQQYRLTKSYKDTPKVVNPVFVGNETVEEQKKVMYESSQTKSYDVEKYYKLMNQIFDLKIDRKTSGASLTEKQCQLKGRIRKRTTFNLHKKLLKTGQCLFEKYGLDSVHVLDNFMVRMQSNDNSFCLELAKFDLKDNRLESSYQTQDFQQVINGRALKCKLFKDVSNGTLSTIVKNYAIGCITYEEESYFLRFMFMYKQGSNLIADKTKDIRIPCQSKVSRFDAIINGNQLFVAYSDTEEKKVYFLERVLIFGKKLKTNKLIDISASAFDLVYSQENKTDENVSRLEIKLIATSFDPDSAENTKNLVFRIDEKNATVEVPLKYQINYERSPCMLSCKYQIDYKKFKDTVLGCAYTYPTSKNTFFHRREMISLKLKEDYALPFYDFQIKHLQVEYLQNEFVYFTLNYSPLSGKRYLIAYKHKFVNSTKLKTALQLSQAELLMYGSIDLTETLVDIDSTDINIFHLNGNYYIALHSGKDLMVYQMMSSFTLTLQDQLSFDRIKNTNLNIVDYQGNVVSRVKLQDFFREKKKLSLTWLWVFLGGLALSTVLVVLYLLFKKRNKHSMTVELANMAELDSDGFQKNVL